MPSNKSQLKSLYFSYLFFVVVVLIPVIAVAACWGKGGGGSGGGSGGESDPYLLPGDSDYWLGRLEGARMRDDYYNYGAMSGGIKIPDYASYSMMQGIRDELLISYGVIKNDDIWDVLGFNILEVLGIRDLTNKIVEFYLGGGGDGDGVDLTPCDSCAGGGGGGDGYGGSG